MNIAYIITGLGLGGAEVITIDIANRTARNGNNALILYLTGENALEHRIDAQVETVGLDLRKTPLHYLKALLKARRILRKFRPDIVHAQMFYACMFARILRLIFYRPKLICTEHANNLEAEYRMRMYRFTDFISDFNTNVSQQAVDYFIEQKAFKRSNSRAVYNGIDLSRFVPNPGVRAPVRRRYGIKDGDFLFLNVGRLNSLKDQHTLIAAFSTLPEARLMIVGEGELEADLKQFAAEKKADGSIIFAGAHNNVEDFYNAADCFVLSSAWEGFGIVLAEAMACALPVITTDAGGCREVVDDDAYVVPPGDSVQLAGKMHLIQTLSPAERQAAGNKNRIKAARFDITHTVAQWTTIYTGLCQGGQCIK